MVRPKIVFERFTAVGTLEVDPSSGINVLIGENGICRPHILNAAECAVMNIDAWNRFFKTFPAVRISRTRQGVQS